MGHSGTAATHIHNSFVGPIEGHALGKEANYRLENEGERVDIAMRGFWADAHPDRKLKLPEVKNADWITFPLEVEDSARFRRAVKSKELVAELLKAQRDGRLKRGSEIFIDKAILKQRIIEAATAKR